MRTHQDRLRWPPSPPSTNQSKPDSCSPLVRLIQIVWDPPQAFRGTYFDRPHHGQEPAPRHLLCLDHPMLGEGHRQAGKNHHNIGHPY